MSSNLLTPFVYTEGSNVPDDVTHVIIHTSVTIIEERAFTERRSLTSIDFSSSSSLSTIDRYAFSQCTSLTSIKLPDSSPSSLITIGDGAFYHCENLETLDLSSNSLYAINGMAFSFCTGLTELQLPNSLKIVGNSAFSFCINLTSVQLPSSLSTFSITAFLNCTKLSTIQAPWSPSSCHHHHNYDNTDHIEYIDISNDHASLRTALENASFYPVPLTYDLLSSSPNSWSFGRYGWHKNLYFDWMGPCRTPMIQNDESAIENDRNDNRSPDRNEDCCRLPLCVAASRSIPWSTKYQLLSKILMANMAAIELTDVSVTGLEPFMLAAVGEESDLEAVYRLLQEYPPAVGFWRQW